MPKSKASIMAERRKKLSDQGLVQVAVHIPPEARERLTAYVESRLKGRVPPQRQPKG